MQAHVLQVHVNDSPAARMVRASDRSPDGAAGEAVGASGASANG